MRKLKTFAFGALAATGFAAQVAAQGAPDTQGGRFSFTPVRDGLLRLDVKTGQVSTCKSDNNGWTCDITPDERTAFDTEIGRLMSENARLKSELGSRSASTGDAAKADAVKADAAKAEAAKAEAMKADAQAKSDRARADAAKSDAVKAEAVAKAEAAKAETAKAEAAKAEAARSEAVAKAETAKADAVRADALMKAEAAKAETAKAELVKAEIAKAELARAEAAKTALPIPPAPIPAPSKSAKVEPAAPAKDAVKNEPAPSGTKAVITIDKNGKSETTITVPLPSDQQVAEAKSFFSRAWQQFVESVNRMFGRG